ncbi:MutT/nudix family protein [Vibrio sinaloensis DSM 21326]|uniref:MutT/nudix family protein n=1 Tax=Vibrio sinaloensis DSM 21326 TaxID=945550 RepID=E8M5V9_PHOS4|nr:NUDIX domain-containing protein [Vibrio sinaloensis]EGA70409.1 MutT/nudix family protein [Vibrio sinaloensis DSM 21326]
MRLYFHHLGLLLTLLLAFVSIPSIAKNTQENFTGAACIIRADDKLVMVNEIITQKLSLPAGRVEAGEDPAKTAQRETWEETGLVVNAVRVLGQTNNTVFYDCVSESDIVSFQFNNVHDGCELPIWFAPHYGVEIASAMLVNPNNIDANEYRYPDQMGWVKQMLAKATNQSVNYVGNLVEAAPHFNQIELSWMLKLQHVVAALPESIRDTIRGSIMSGNVFSLPFLLIMLLPFVYLRYGKHFSYKIFFAITVTALMSIVAQQGFAFPRPHVYLPAVELIDTYGYSFPSKSVAIWMCVGVLLLHAENKLSINPLSVAILGIVTWLGLAKFYTGSAFIVDILSGALLGFLCAWHIIRLEVKPEVDTRKLLTSKIVWAGLLVICTFAGLFWPSPVMAHWFAVITTVLILVSTLKDNNRMVSSSTVYLVTIALLAMNVALTLAVEAVSYSTGLSLAVELVRYPLIIALFVVTVRKVQQAA